MRAADLASLAAVLVVWLGGIVLAQLEDARGAKPSPRRKPAARARTGRARRRRARRA